MLNESVVTWMLLLSLAAPANAQQLNIGIGYPNLRIGLSLPLYPELVPVPGYPVYYAAGLESNYFFYDGLYWIFLDDNWYASSWYNGPWGLVDPEYVPLFVLRIPVRYYRQPPFYFSGWQLNSPPRWGEHWGNQWAQRRSGWDSWDHNAPPARPPLPVYQRKYAGDHYPPLQQQQELQRRNYGYQPQDPIVRQQYQAQHLQDLSISRQQSAPIEPQRSTEHPGLPHANQPTTGQRHPLPVPQGQAPLPQGRPEGQGSQRSQAQTAQKPRAIPAREQDRANAADRSQELRQ